MLARQMMTDRTLVTVVPITHARPGDAEEAVEIPPAIKAHLGLDPVPSWIVVSEVNDFCLAGSRSAPRFDFGVLPPGFFRKVRDQMLALIRARRVSIVPRSQ